MGLSANSLAAAVGASAENVQFAPSADVLPRKIVIIGTYDPAKTSVVDNVPVLVTDEADVGAKTGFGFMLHRLAVRTFAGGQGVETWIVPQPEAGGATAAAGDIDFTGSVPTENATLYLYIAGIAVPVTVSDSDADTDIATNVVAAVNADDDLPVTAAVNGGTPAQVDFTSKSKGPWGDLISLTFNWGFQEELPAGVVAVVTDMTGGAGLPDVDDALDGLGTGDDQNVNHNTDVVHGYGQDSTTLNKISVYNGIGDTKTGNYAKLVSRPFRVLDGDVEPGSSALSALVALGDGRRETDRTNGIIAAPGSPNHPAEVAAVTIGIMARVNNDRAEESYIGQVLPGIIPGALADRWTRFYDSRDTALKAGISPTKAVGNALILQNVATFYHPTSVPITSNVYRSMRNISIVQNVLNAERVNFSGTKWQGISIVADVTKVSNSISREKARDIDAVIDDLLRLTIAFEGRAWIFTAAFTIERLQAGGLVTIRAGGTGFDSTLPLLVSGEGGIFDTVTQFDASLAVLLQ